MFSLLTEKLPEQRLFFYTNMGEFNKNLNIFDINISNIEKS